MMNMRQQMIALVDAYAAAVGRSPQTVSQQFLRHNQKIDRLRAGRDLGTELFEEARTKFWEQWPAGVEWPSDVLRPTSEAAE